MFNVKKAYFKMGSFHSEDFAISAVILYLQEILGESRRRYKLYSVHRLLKTTGRKLSRLESQPHQGEAGNWEHCRGVLNCYDKGSAALPWEIFFLQLTLGKKEKKNLFMTLHKVLLREKFLWMLLVLIWSP